MKYVLLGALAALLVAAPFDLSARQVVKHHKAKAQTANPNCVFGTTSAPAGTQCATGDLTPGGALANTDAIMICQVTGGCFGNSPSLQWKSVQLPSYMRSGFSAVAPLNYNLSTGAFSLTTPNAALVGGNGSTFTSVSVGSGLNLSGGTLTATGTTLVVPNASLVGGNGTALNGVAVGSGLNLSGGTLTATGTSLTIPNANIMSGNGSSLGSVAVGSGLNLGGTWPTQTLTATGTTLTVPSAQLLGGTGSALTGVSVGSGLNLTGGTLTATGPAGAVSQMYTGTVTGTNTYQASTSNPAHTANVAGDLFCSTFPNSSTAVSTLQVGSAPALPINVQYGTTATVQAGAGDIPANASLCFLANPGTPPTAWIKQTSVPGAIVRDPVPGGTHPVSAFEWATNYTFIFTTGGQTLQFPVVTGLSPQGGVTIVTVSPATVTLQPGAGDSINSGAPNATVIVAGNVTSMATTSGSAGASALSIPVGEQKIFPFSWGPNANLSTVAIPLVTRVVSIPVVTISCVVGGAAPASSFIDVCYAPDGTVPTPNTACTAPAGVVKLTTGAHCDASTGTVPAGQQQSGLISTPVTVPGGSHIWVVGNGSGWATGGTSLNAISGKLQVTMVP